MSVETVTPHGLITKEHVVTALMNDKGATAHFISFEINDFTAKGDNFVCVVSSVKVEYNQDGKKQETSYVVKVNPCRSADFDLMSQLFFEKEIAFYNTLLPLLNNELKRVNEPELCAPRCYHCVPTRRREVIFLQDLRRDGFKMANRQTGLSKEHTKMIFAELARLHAASHLLMSHGKYLNTDLKEHFPFLKEALTNIDSSEGKFTMAGILESSMENAAKIAGQAEGYEKVKEYLLTKKDNAYSMLKDQLEVSEQFKTICHGDCWTNNFLFRYSESGAVEECRLLDFQIVRVGSPALDMNYMLYCSLNDDVRNAGLDDFLTTYYTSLASVMAAAGVPTKFTLSQLQQEFTNKKTFGLLMGVIDIPMIMMNSEDAVEFDIAPDEQFEDKMKDFEEALMKQVKNNPLMKPRFLGLFDDMMKAGIIQ